MEFSDRIWPEFHCDDDRKRKERLLCERGQLEVQNVTQIQLSVCSDFSMAQLHELISQISQARKLRGLHRIFLNESLFRDCPDLLHELFLCFDSRTTSPPVCLSNSYLPSLIALLKCDFSLEAFPYLLLYQVSCSWNVFLKHSMLSLSLELLYFIIITCFPIDKCFSISFLFLRDLQTV